MEGEVEPSLCREQGLAQRSSGGATEGDPLSVDRVEADMCLHPACRRKSRKRRSGAPRCYLVLAS